MWPVQQAPVRNGRNRGKQLNGRDAHLLAHRNRPDGDCRPVLEPPQQSLALAGQIHAGQLAESEGANVIVKFRRSQLQGDLIAPTSLDRARMSETVSKPNGSWSRIRCPARYTAPFSQSKTPSGLTIPWSKAAASVINLKVEPGS